MYNLLMFAGKTVIVCGIGTFFIFLLKENIKSFIQYSIKYVFDKKIEDYKTNEIKRQKTILIADLLSEWISWPEHRKKLNQLTLEAFIWLPKDVAIKLSKLLSLDRNSSGIREIVAEVRKLILGEDEVIDSNKIIIFPEESKKEDANSATTQ